MKNILACLALSALLLAACGASPEPGFYTLAPAPGVAAADVTGTIKIDRPALPGFLDRPDFVSLSGPYQVGIDETANWASPLDLQFARVLAEDLQQRLPAATVRTDADDGAMPPRFVVDTSLDQFNPVDGGEAALRGQMTLTDHAAHTQDAPAAVDFTADTGFGGPAAAARALSDLIGQYADRIVLTLRAAAKES